MFSVELGATDHTALRVDVIPKVKGSISHAQTLGLRDCCPIASRYILFEIMLEVSDIISIKLKGIGVIIAV